MLLDLDQRAFGKTLVEEGPGSGEKFPHPYAHILLSTIAARRALLPDGKGNVDLSFL